VYKTWFSLAMNVARLALESQQVIALRMARLASGGSSGDREARLMVSEKIDTMGETVFAASLLAAAGRGAPAIATDVVRRYRKRVRGNAKRLSRRPR
jgi:hypothetical protein